MKTKLSFRGILIFATSIFILSFIPFSKLWQSKFAQLNTDGSLHYSPDAKGNIIPDFSLVGYFQGDKPIPDIPIVKTINPLESGDARDLIQSAINEVATRNPDQNGFRGAILLKKGTYKIRGSLNINASGIVLRGEGDDKNGTKLIATERKQHSLLLVTGKGNRYEIANTRVKIIDEYLPTGSKSFRIASVDGLKEGDKIIVYRPGTSNWIHDLKMDQIVERSGTLQWKAKDYNFQFERVITKIQDNRIFIDNPIVMAMETKYGGGEVYKYKFDGRITEVGVEHILFDSEYEGDIDENHGWEAVLFDKIENGWIRNITAVHYGYSCVNLGNHSKFITVADCKCLDAKSQITGGRRYSFNNTGQMNFFTNCHAEDGRHDYVTGAKVCGPNVFYNCTAKKTHADIGPHHRWAMGTLFDNIVTDGEINIQDRGQMGSGHGWAGATQVLWNCKVEKAVVQNPWVSANNYCIGLQGKKDPGHFKDREDGEWEGQNKKGLVPASLYLAQFKARHQNYH